jgi:hypothetical protein
MAVMNGSPAMHVIPCVLTHVATVWDVTAMDRTVVMEGVGICAGASAALLLARGLGQRTRDQTSVKSASGHGRQARCYAVWTVWSAMQSGPPMVISGKWTIYSLMTRPGQFAILWCTREAGWPGDMCSWRRWL